MRTGGTTGHRCALEPLGLPPVAAERLAAYLDLLAAWSRQVNLTAARTAEARVALLVAPVWAFAARLEPGTLLDVGSGNGSPGLVLAALRPDLAATLLEPRQRRWAFLREAARRADVGAEVLRCRHDGYDGPPAQTVTVRALALSLCDLGRLVQPGGTVVVMGPAPPGDAGFAPIAWGLSGVHACQRVVCST